VPARTVGRITSRAALASVQRARSRGASGPVRVLFSPVDPTAEGLFPQVGYAVGRRCGNAVTRNTLRRRAREVVRAEASHLQRGTYLVRLDPAAARLDRAEFRADVVKALTRAAGRSEA
jgi:ribonuclease P protein component